MALLIVIEIWFFNWHHSHDSHNLISLEINSIPKHWKTNPCQTKQLTSRHKQNIPSSFLIQLSFLQTKQVQYENAEGHEDKDMIRRWKIWLD